MAKGFEIAEGYLGIDADVSGALKDVRRFFQDVEKELGDVEKEFEKGGKVAGEDFAKGTEEGAKKGAEEVTKTVTKQLRDAKGRFAKAGSDVGDEFTKTVTESIQRRTKTKGKGLLDDLLPGDIGGGKGFFKSLIGGASEFFSVFAKGFSAAVDQAKSLWEGASSFFQQASNIAGGIGSVAMFAGYAALVPIVLALGGALMQLSAALFALPAAAGVAIAIIAPLMIAFKGFGEAIGAGFSGDAEKFKAALKGLAEPAQTVVKEIVALKGILSAIKKDVQSAFFAPMIGIFKVLGYTLLPVLRGGLADVADSLGRFVAGLLDILASKGALESLAALFQTTSRIIDVMGPSIQNVFGLMFGLIKTGLPFVERFFGWIAKGIDSFALWLQKANESGKITTWLERAAEIGGQVWDVLKKTGELIATIFGNTGDEGSSFLVNLAGQLDSLNKFFKSKDGQQFINIMADLIQVVIVFGVVGVNAIRLFGTATVWVVAAVKTLWHWLVVAWDWIAKAVPAAGRWFADLGKSIWSWVVGAAKAVAGFFVSIGKWFASAWGVVVDTGAKIINWFAELPGRIWTWLQSLPGVIHDAWLKMYDAVLYGIGALAAMLVNFWTVDLPGWVRSGWAWVKQYVEEGATKTWERIKALPGQIWTAISTLASIIGGAVIDAWHWAVQYTEEGATKTWNRITALPGQIWEALKNLASMIGGFFSDAWTKSKNNTITGVNNVMDWIKGLPGKAKDALKDAGTWLWDAGKNMLHGLVDGLKDTLDWAIGRAKDMAGKIKDGFLSALEVKSPSQVMRREVGRQLLPGVMQGVDDTLPGMQRYLGTVSPKLVAGLNPNVNVGGPTVNVDGTRVVVMLDSKEIAAGIMLDPGKVAAATDEGRRQRSWAYSPRAKR